MNKKYQSPCCSPSPRYVAKFTLLYFDLQDNSTDGYRLECFSRFEPNLLTLPLNPLQCQRVHPQGRPIRNPRLPHQASQVSLDRRLLHR